MKLMQKFLKGVFRGRKEETAEETAGGDDSKEQFGARHQAPSKSRFVCKVQGCWCKEVTSPETFLSFEICFHFQITVSCRQIWTGVRPYLL